MDFLYKILVALVLVIGISSVSQAQCRNGVCFAQPQLVAQPLIVPQYNFGSYYNYNYSMSVYPNVLPTYNYSYYNYRVVQPVYVPQVYCIGGRCYYR